MPLVLINPEIELRGETEVGIEGCLSFPEITGDIERAQSVTVRAQTLDGEIIQIEASGFLARAVQHEGDHLNGILFIDRMRSAAKAALSSRLRRLQKETKTRDQTRRRAGDRDHAVADFFPPASVSKRNRNAQERRRNRRGIIALAFVLAVEQSFEFILQVSSSAVLSAASNAFMVGRSIS